jgi:hypothetical protein
MLHDKSEVDVVNTPLCGVADLEDEEISPSTGKLF